MGGLPRRATHERERRAYPQGGLKAMPYKLPRIPKDHIPYILREAADKIERGEALKTGKSESGGRYIEGDMIACVLRAVAEGKSPIKALVGNGPVPKSVHAILKRFEDEFSNHGG